MPYFTPTYKLRAFLLGEGFSLSGDQERMEIIDNELAFISDILGQGVIDGWHVTDNSVGGQLGVSISPGIGIIGKNAIFTYGSFGISLESGKKYHLYMQKKPGILGGFSPFSSPVNISHVDSYPPLSPQNLSINSVGVNDLTVNWDSNVEPDIGSYKVKRSADNITYSDIAVVEAGSYQEIGLSQDTIYYYKVTAIDKSGNESVESSVVFAKTLKDLSVPANADSIFVLGCDKSIQIVYSPAQYGLIDHYEVDAQPLDNSYTPDGLSFSVSASIDDSGLRIENLENNKLYEITFYSVSVNGVSSNKFVTRVNPLPFYGPDEISNLVVSYIPGYNIDQNVVIDLSWDISLEPYADAIEFFLVTFYTEDGRSSIPIVFPANSDYRISAIQFNTTDGIETVDVPARTRFLMRIQSRSSVTGDSAGIFRMLNTPSFKRPLPVRSISLIENRDLTILASWLNMDSNVKKNIITVTRDNTDSGFVVLFSDKDIGLQNFFIIEKSFWVQDSTYVVSVTSVDDFGNESHASSATAVTESVDFTILPEPPSQQDVVIKNGNLSVVWGDSPSEGVVSTRIWRTVLGGRVDNSSFTMIVELDKNQHEFVDYSAIKGISYGYMLTAIDEYGRETASPLDGITSFGLSSASIPFTDNFARPSGVSANIISSNPVDSDFYNTEIKWMIDGGDFDGYQVYRSDGNQYSYKMIASLAASDNSFVDNNVLLKTRTPYYYIVRKFRNEADPVLLESASIPQGSILIADINTISGSVDINTVNVRNLLNAEDPIREITKTAVDIHKHDISGGADKRISFDENVIINDFVTTDFQNYATEQNISGASEFFVFENGTQTNRLYVIDTDGGKIHFDSALFSQQDSISGLTPPVITLELFGVSEIIGKLQSDKLGDINASQLQFGKIPKEQLPGFSHEGRLKQKLLPIQESTASKDGVLYFTTSNKREVSSLTFYDIIGLKDNTDGLIAASNKGIVVSYDFGATWSVVYLTATPITKLFYSQSSDRYFAISFSHTFTSKNGIDSWSEFGNIRSEKIIRDITEDGSDNVLISTNLGVCSINTADISSVSWSQTSIMNQLSTETFGILYDEYRNRIIVSNESYLYSTNDSGVSWAQTGEVGEFTRIYSFVERNNFIFCFTGKYIMRLGPSDTVFSIISESSFGNGKIVIFKDRIYLSSESGLFVSADGVNIYTDEDVKMVNAIPSGYKGYSGKPITSLNVISDVLFAGTDNSIYTISDGGSVNLPYNNDSVDAPSIYINGVIKNIGVYYSRFNNRDVIAFSEELSNRDIVTVSYQYGVFKIENGGWADVKFDAPVSLLLNGNNLYSNITSSISDVDVKNIQLPSFNDSTSSITNAKKYQDDVLGYISSIYSTSSSSSVSITYIQFRILCEKLNRFLSQIENGIENFVFPTASAVFDGGVLNATEGIVNFTSPFGKYDKITADIFEVMIDNSGDFTHQQIDDNFELYNSGLTGGLANVEQANIIKLGIFSNRKWGSERNLIAKNYQSDIIIPKDKEYYDVLNSTIDFSFYSGKNEVGQSVTYPADAIFLEDVGSIFVGFSNGYADVNTSTLEIAFKLFNTEQKEFLRKFLFTNGVLYALTDINLYSSSDYGSKWIQEDRTGLPDVFYNLSTVANNLVISGKGGLFVRVNNGSFWSNSLKSENEISVMNNNDVLIVIDGDTIFYSGSGIAWNNAGKISKELQINSITKHKSIIFVATNSGLYKDDGSFHSNGDAALSLVDLLNDTQLSQTLSFNDVVSDGTSIYASLDDGTYWKNVGGIWSLEQPNYIDVIHKIILAYGELWLFGLDLLKAPGIETPIKLSTGTPL